MPEPSYRRLFARYDVARRDLLPAHQGIERAAADDASSY
jgi:hypothetical protein